MMNKKVISSRTRLTVYSTNKQFTVIIPPVYTWNKYDYKIYFFIFSLIIFIALNIALVINFLDDNNFFILFYCACFLFSYFSEKKICSIVNDVQLVMLAFLSYACFRDESYIHIAISIILIIENLLFADIRSELLKDILDITKIKIDNHNFIIEKASFFRSKLIIHSKKTCFNLSSTNTRIKLDNIVLRIILMYTRTILNRRVKFKIIDTIEKKTYLLGFFLKKSEMGKLFNEIKKYRKDTSQEKYR